MRTLPMQKAGTSTSLGKGRRRRRERRSLSLQVLAPPCPPAKSQQQKPHRPNLQAPLALLLRQRPLRQPGPFHRLRTTSSPNVVALLRPRRPPPPPAPPRPHPPPRRRPILLSGCPRLEISSQPRASVRASPLLLRPLFINLRRMSSNLKVSSLWQRPFPLPPSGGPSKLPPSENDSPSPPRRRKEPCL